MKFASLIFSVEATRPPTFTCAPGPNSTPFGFTRNTLPLADRLPAMFDGSEPTTRLSATEFAFGCTNRTPSAGAIPKLCQLIAVFWLDWLIVIWLAAFEMLALPAETTPPAGNANALEAHRRANDPASAVDPSSHFFRLAAKVFAGVKLPVSWLSLGRNTWFTESYQSC